MFPAASRPHSSQKTVSTQWMFGELREGRKREHQVHRGSILPHTWLERWPATPVQVCMGRHGRAQNLSVSPSSQVPLCTLSFFGLIESEELKYLERSGHLEKHLLTSTLALVYSFFLESVSILVLTIPKFRSTLWTLGGPRPYVSLPFRHLLLNVHRNSPCQDLISASSCLQTHCVF